MTYYWTCVLIIVVVLFFMWALALVVDGISMLDWLRRKFSKGDDVFLGPTPTEHKFNEIELYNPLGRARGEGILIDDPRLEDDNVFTLGEVEIYRRSYNGEVFEFADYHIESPIRKMVLRVMPDAGSSYRSILMWQVDWFTRDQFVQQASFVDPLTLMPQDIEFKRLNGNKVVWECSIRKVRDMTSNGRVPIDIIPSAVGGMITRREDSGLRYVDYISDEGQYLFVELGTRSIRTYTGFEVFSVM